jgi:hypothetical protein
MGLFSGSFGTGLVTGLATSVDKSLRDAMDKRDEEMSAARRFWQTRQAQKLDMKEEHDRRAGKALDRFITEANGDVALGLAAYQAAGGSPDAAEAFIKRIDDTRAAKGTFSLTDSLTGLPEGYKTGDRDITRESALGSISMPMKGIDASNIAVDDPLANIGLGLKGGAANRVADSVNGLIPPSEATQVEGLTGVQIDMSRMLEAEQYARDLAKYEKAMAPSNFEEALFQNTNSLNALKRENYDSDEAFQTARNAVLEERGTILTNISDLARAEEAAGNTGVSDSIMRVIWTDTREQYRKIAGIGGKDETRFYTDANDNMVLQLNDPKGYARAVEAADAQAANLFVKTQRNEDGSFSTSATNIIGTDRFLKSAYSNLTGESTEPAEEGEAPDAPKATDYTIAANVQANPGGFADTVFAAKPDVKPEDLYRTLINSNVPPEKAAEEAERIYKKQQENAAAAANAPKYVPGQGLVTAPTKTETPVGDDGYKTSGEIKWRPDYAPDMTRILSNKDVDISIRNEVLEDYVALMVSRGDTNLTIKDAAKKFGIE